MTERFQQLLLPAQGRKLVVISGDGIIDYFFLGNAKGGAKDIVDSLHRIGAEEGFEITLSFDTTGQPAFFESKMEKLWKELTEASTADRPGEGPKQEFQPKSARPKRASSVQETVAVQRTESEAAFLALRNLIGKAERAMRSGQRVLLIFREPEELYHGELSREARDLMRQSVMLSTCRGAHPESRIVLIVKPGRREDFLRTLNWVSVTPPVLQTIELSVPGGKELRAFLDFRMLVDAEALLGTDGERGRVVTEWTQRRELLRNLEEALNSLLRRPDRPQRIERVLDRQPALETAEDVLKDLDRLVGLDKVKAHLRKLFQLVEQQNQDRRAGRVTRPVNTHMLFLGNPGTGKTEVARIIGRYLRAIGLRSSGAFVEISRSDISSQFNSGECITKMRDHIARSMGGVLFVDEAYQLAEGGWMQGALETLMKDMEDRRDSFTVIFAGYEEQMQRLWRVNPGFRSRIPKDNDFIFPDYTAEELQEIFRRECVRRQLELSGDSESQAKKFIACELRRGRFGNARGVRNLVEEIEQRRAIRGGGAVVPAMVPAAAAFDGERVKILLGELEKTLVGIDDLRKFLVRTAREVQAADEEGKPMERPLHCRFVGPPGTGKTTAARSLGEIFKAMGLLSRGHVQEVNPIADLGSQYVSEYAQRVKERFQLARGGVLFIDEAYQLAEQEQGRQIIHQIVQELTSPGFADTVVILAGYRDKMNDLLAVNSGLERRIPNEIIFKPFSVDELIALFHLKLDGRDYVIQKSDLHDFDAALRSKFEGMLVSPGFGNAAAVESLVEEVISRQIERVQSAGSGQKFRVLTADVGTTSASPDEVSLMLERFEQQFVGLLPVKERVRAVVNETRISRALGGARPKAPRMLFLGNPGTGKTSAARELSRILKVLDCTASDRFVETRGTELKAGYVGQTKDRVLKEFQNARGGVLFIDEAYALRPPASAGADSDTFALEAIDTLVGLVTLPENSQTVVILSGYTAPMQRFLQSNPGLASRFPETVTFPDYSAEECVEILSRWIARVEPDNALPLEGGTIRGKLLAAITAVKNRDGFGNAREMETLGMKIREVRNRRLAKVPYEQIRQHSRLTRDDVMGGVESWQTNQIKL